MIKIERNLLLNLCIVSLLLISAPAKSDIFNGTPGDDIINGTSGDDSLFGFTGNDTLNGGAGNDLLSGSSGHDILNGDIGNDSIFGGGGNDTINGGDGDDLLTGGGGHDIIDGGSGIDTISYASSNSNTTVDLSVIGAQDTLSTGNDTLINIENITGSDFADTLSGNTGNNTLSGGLGDDSLYGLAGNDTLNGGAGNDLLSGSSGHDILNGDIGNDSIFGGGGNDTINGGDGDDRLTGGGGNDLLNGGDGNDIFNFVLNGGLDTLTDFSNGDLLDVTGLFSTAETSGDLFADGLLKLEQHEGFSMLSFFVSDSAQFEDFLKMNGFTDSLSSFIDNDDSYFLQYEATSAVPIPGAAWLFGSGLLGLFGIARHKRKS